MNHGASQVALVVKNPPANAGDRRDVGRSLGPKDPLEEEMATHSRILAWRVPWTEEPGRLQSRGSHRVEHDWACMQAPLTQGQALVRIESPWPRSGFQGRPLPLGSDLCPLLGFLGCPRTGGGRACWVLSCVLPTGLRPVGTVPPDAQEGSRVSEVAHLLLRSHRVWGPGVFQLSEGMVLLLPVDPAWPWATSQKTMPLHRPRAPSRYFSFPLYWLRFVIKSSSRE